MNGIMSRGDEKVLWQGRPAPRCYTFQYWKQALIGSTLFLASSFWLMLALELIGEGHPFWLALFPLPLVVGSFIFGPLQIIIARWRWAKIFYQLTEQSLYFTESKSVQLAEITEIKVKRMGKQLASLRVAVEGSSPLIIHCIEQPDSLLALLNTHCPQLKV